MTAARRRVALVIGTRPEAIKVAPVALAAQETGLLETIVIATGQHDELVDQALGTFGVDIDRRIVLGSRSAGSQAELLARLLPELEAAVADLAPDALLVQGDTASAVAGAMAATWRRTPVVHLEAGLRSFDKANPFPEETYRRLIAAMADLHLAPTPSAMRNLLAEGIAAPAIICTGNTVVDAARHASAVVDVRTRPQVTPGRRLVLVTVHRRENWGEPLRAVVEALRLLVERFEDIEVVLPVHPNPIVRRPITSALAGIDRICVVDPFDHPSMMAHLAQATLVLTDSGGIQEEAPAFGAPVLVLRHTTERPEAVEAGCAELVGTDAGDVVRRAAQLLGDEAARSAMANVANPFGDGHSGTRSVEAMAWFLGCGTRPRHWSPAVVVPA